MSDEENISHQEGDVKYLTIKAVGQDSVEVHFKVKKTLCLGKLKTSYCKKRGIDDLKSVRFMYNGRQFKDTDTPKMLEMEEGDVIDVWQDQTGGSF